MDHESHGGRLHPYVDWLFEIDPILASTMGDLRRSASLGDVSADALRDQQRRRVDLLADARATPVPPRGSVDWLEHQVLITELATSTRRAEVERVGERVPYWYVERLGEALSVLMSDPSDAASGEALASRLKAAASYLQSARDNLTESSPQIWAEMASTAARGLERFVGQSIATYAAELPGGLSADVARSAAHAAVATSEFAAFADGLAARANGDWASGTAHFDFLLRSYHHLDIDSAALAEHGRQLVIRERTELERIAAARDRDSSWQQQIDEIKDWNPEPAQFLATYGEAMRRAREHTLRADLVTVPDGAVCDMRWVPEYRRDGLPLGVMSPTPPYGPGLRSSFMITPADPSAGPERVRQHRRDNSYVFATTIAGHETYPGHHVQYAHHKIGTPRDSIRRYFATPQFVEGWGLYVEDVLDETGFMSDDRLRLVRARNALWRALRVVVDVGLHTGGMSFEQAGELMRTEAGMDEHMAAGEVRRYVRHDNPTYPSSYMLGRELIHQIRGRYSARRGAEFRLHEFHDWLLSFGSPPLPLVAQIDT